MESALEIVFRGDLSGGGWRSIRLELGRYFLTLGCIRYERSRQMADKARRTTSQSQHALAEREGNVERALTVSPESPS